MASKKVLEVVIAGDPAGAKKAFAETETAAQKMSSGIKGALAGVAAVGFLSKAFGEAQEAQKVAAQTTAAIKSTGNAAEFSAKQSAELADSLSKVTGIDDEAIGSVENMLRTFTQIKANNPEQVFQRTTAAALDMSTAMGTDATSAALMLGKALNDPLAGISKLTRAGVTFSASQKEQIKTYVELGQTAKAQAVILSEVEREFGGSAEAQATAADKAKVAFDNLAESVGTALAPAFEKAATAGAKAADVFSSQSEGLQQAELALIAGAIVWGKYGTAITAAGAAGLRFATNLAVPTSAITGLGSAAEGTTAAVNGLKLSMGGALAVAGSLAAGSYVLARQIEDARSAAEKQTDALTAGKDPLDALRILQGKYGEALTETSKVGAEALRQANANNDNFAKGIELTKEGRKAWQEYQQQLLEAGTAAQLSAAQQEGLLTGQKSWIVSATIATRRADEMAAGLEGVGTAADKADVAVGRFSSMIDEFLGRELSMAEASDRLQSDINGVADALVAVVQQGGAFDGPTDGAIRYREQMRSVVEDSGAVLKTMAEQGAGADELKAAQERLAQSFEDQAVAMGVPRAEAKKYADQLRSIPAYVSTVVEIDYRDVSSGNHAAQNELNQRSGFGVTHTASTMAGRSPAGTPFAPQHSGKAGIQIGAVHVSTSEPPQRWLDELGWRVPQMVGG